MRHSRFSVALGVTGLLVRSGWTDPSSSAFAYLGQLKRSGLSICDSADFEFCLWDAPMDGNMVGSTQNLIDVAG